MNELQWTGSNERDPMNSNELKHRKKTADEFEIQTLRRNSEALTKTLLVIARICDGIRRFQMNTISLKFRRFQHEVRITEFVLRNSSCW